MYVWKERALISAEKVKKVDMKQLRLLKKQEPIKESIENNNNKMEVVKQTAGVFFCQQCPRITYTKKGIDQHVCQYYNSHCVSNYRQRATTDRNNKPLQLIKKDFIIKEILKVTESISNLNKIIIDEREIISNSNINLCEHYKVGCCFYNSNNIETTGNNLVPKRRNPTTKIIQFIFDLYTIGHINIKNKISAETAYKAMTMVGTKLGEETFPHIKCMTQNPHGYPTFCRNDILDIEQIKAYFGYTNERLLTILNNTKTKEAIKTTNNHQPAANLEVCSICDLKNDLIPTSWVSCDICTQWDHQSCAGDNNYEDPAFQYICKSCKPI